MSVLISNNERKILSASIDKTEMIFYLFDSQKIYRKIVFRLLQIFNELEPVDSEYRKIV